MHSFLIFTSKWQAFICWMTCWKRKITCARYTWRMLTFVSTASKTSEVHLVLLGRSIIWIPLYMFWLGVISTNFYKAPKTSNRNSTSINIRIIAYLEDMLLMCQTIQGLNKARDKIDFSFKATGFQNKSEKISTISNPETRIFGPANRLSQHDSNSANGKSKKLHSGMQELDGK